MARGFPSVSDSPSLSRSTSWLLGTALLLIASACGRPIDPVSSCTDIADCAAGQACSAGACVDATATISCTTDLECDVSQNQICRAGVCAVAGDGGPNTAGSCTETADCPINEFCNTATGVCSTLLAGWCRLDSQCGAAAPLCSNALQGGQDFPGRCIECLGDADCDGATCGDSGVCEVDTGCGENASPVVGGDCRCNAGFSDERGACVPDPQNLPTEGEGDEEPIGGEGEGEGEGNQPVPTGACTRSADCFESDGFNFSCNTDEGACFCDTEWLDTWCGAGAWDIDTCDCAEAGGGGGGGDASAFNNEPCIEDADCGGGTSCIYGGGADLDWDLGACKTLCDVDAECDGGLTCMTNVFEDGSGICATPRAAGETCEASSYSVNIDTDAMCDASGDAFLFCFSGRCEQVCDWDGNSGPAETCEEGSCGTIRARTETGGGSGDLAVCE